MADSKVTALATLASADIAAGDWVPIVDVSDTSMAASGTTKKIDASDFMLLSGDQTIAGTKTFSDPPKTSTITMAAIQLTNTQIAPLSSWTPVTNGLVFVMNIAYSKVAAFMVQGGGNSVVELGFDVSSQFSATGGTASSVNLYYHTGVGYVIENKMGQSIYVRVFAVGS